MEKIKKYVARFIRTVKISDAYDLTAAELIRLSLEADKGDNMDIIGTTFFYGYAKGYLAAHAEMKTEKARAAKCRG